MSKVTEKSETAEFAENAEKFCSARLALSAVMF